MRVYAGVFKVVTGNANPETVDATVLHFLEVARDKLLVRHSGKSNKV